MAVFDVIIGVMALLSLALIVRNMRLRPSIELPVKLGEDVGELAITVNGKRYRGIAYRSVELPSIDGNASDRIARIASSMGVNVTFLSSMFRVDKSSLLRFLDDEIKRVEMAYNITKHVKYREKLRSLQELYKIASKTHTPYQGSLQFIVWVPDDEEDGKSLAEAFKTLLEAEIGGRFERVKGGLRELFEKGQENVISRNWRMPLPSKAPWDVPGTVIGYIFDEPQALVVLEWPRDFATHIGVFGPTGRGKTVLLSGIALQLGSMSEARLDPYMVVVIDPKGDLASMLRLVATKFIEFSGDQCIPLPRTDGVAELLIKSSTSSSEFKGRVGICEGSLVERGLIVYDLSNAKNEDRNMAGSLIISSLVISATEYELPGKVVVLVDEAWRLTAGDSFHVRLALREGRSRGLYMVYASQSPNDVPREVLDNTKTIVMFGGYTRGFTESLSVIGVEDAEELLSLPVGHALLRLGDKPPVKVRIIDFATILQSRLRVEHGSGAGSGPG